MIWVRRDSTRLLLVVGACAVIGHSWRAEAASAQDCRAFHQECMEARAEGYRDVGICNVERLECSADHDVRVPEQSRERRDDDRNDAERAVGERSVGP